MNLVTGGTGFVGAHVVRALLARGEAVRCLVRPTSRMDLLDGLPVERVVGDVADLLAIQRAVAGCEAVFHCAADYRLGAPRPAELYRSNVEGTRCVLAACADAGVRRVVYTSTVGALGHRADGGSADETTPARLEDMIGAYKRSKFLAEREAEAWARRGLAVVIVNPSTPVGDGDVKPTPTGRIIVDFVDGRMPAYVDTGLNLIDVRDVAEGHLLAAERGKPGERYILGHRNLTLREVLEILSPVAGRPAPTLELPHWIPWLVAAISAPLAVALQRTPALSVESVAMSRRRMFFDAAKAVRELGLPQNPVEEALARAVRWFRARGYTRGRS
jgi:dihydroflavonol-4-reductase